MSAWEPPTLEQVLRWFEGELECLHPKHQRLVSEMRISPRQIPVAMCPGESVWAVAEHEGKFLYYSDVEEGWELATLNDDGGIEDRGCSQFELGHIAWQLFGDPSRK